jgi:small subunit ribosomal protein S6
LETVTNKLYEGMFLVDAARAGSDWDSVISTIKRILERAGSEIVSLRKWDDRKLAYEIKGQSRGVYILCYFRVDGEKIPEIENNVRLSEQIMRVLILNAEQMSQEDIEKDTPAAKAEKEGQKAEEEASEEETEVHESDEEDSQEELESDDEDFEEEDEDEQSWEVEENEQDDDDEDNQDEEDSDSDSDPDD